MSLENELKKLGDQINPDERWVSSNRAFLLKKISEQVPDPRLKTVNSQFAGFMREVKTFGSGKWLMGLARPVVGLVVIMGLVLGSGQFTVNASKQSLPGDKLYFVKRALENAQLKLATKGGHQIKLEVLFAQERMNEIKKIAVNGKIDNFNKKDIIPAIKDIKGNYDSIKNKLNQIKEQPADSHSEIIRIAKLVDTNTQEVSGSLKEVMADMNSDEGDLVVRAAIDSVGDAGMRALDMMAEEVNSDGAAKEEKTVRTKEKLKQSKDEVKDSGDFETDSSLNK